MPCVARPPAPPALAIASRTRRGANPSGLGCVWTGSSPSLSGPVGLVLCLSMVAADPGRGWLRGARQTHGGALGMLHRRKGRCVRQKASPPSPSSCPAQARFGRRVPCGVGGLASRGGAYKYPAVKLGPLRVGGLGWRVRRVISRSMSALAGALRPWGFCLELLAALPFCHFLSISGSPESFSSSLVELPCQPQRGGRGSEMPGPQWSGRGPGPGWGGRL